LIVEVSDTTLRYDLRIKAGLYARAGIVEYWGG
jgi:Uma2 family endonuclease